MHPSSALTRTTLGLALAVLAAGGAAAQGVVNARAGGELLDRFATPDEAGRALLMRAGEAGGLTARGWTRTLRLARTIADLAGSEAIATAHLTEAIGYRRLERGRTRMAA